MRQRVTPRHIASSVPAHPCRRVSRALAVRLSRATSVPTLAQQRSQLPEQPDVVSAFALVAVLGVLPVGVSTLPQCNWCRRYNSLYLALMLI